MGKIIKGIVYVLLALSFVVAATYLSSWITGKPSFKENLEPTGEERYACITDWRNDIVIEDCKFYPVYRKK